MPRGRGYKHRGGIAGRGGITSGRGSQRLQRNPIPSPSTSHAIPQPSPSASQAVPHPSPSSSQVVS